MYLNPFIKSSLVADPSVVEKKWFKLYASVTGEEATGRMSPAYQWLMFIKEQYEPREYHNLDHIGYMRELFNIECRDLARDPDAIEWAIWFHDIVNFTRPPMNGMNEDLSGQIAGQDPRLKPSFIWKAQLLIRSTSHKGVFLDSDCAIIRDLDLAILGTVEMAYDVYEARVRKEYAWVPDDIWRIERVQVLQDFIDRGYIYETEFWRDQREDQALSNLTRAINTLTQ